MKKIIAILLFIIAVNCTADAAVGDVAGNVYSTDIKTYMFDHQLNAYNIGGKTVIICEDLGWYYGFNVDWKADERVLEITDTSKNREYVSDVSFMTQRDISQNIANRPKDYFERKAPEHIYYTDIVTTLDGRRINSYNVNGRTAIVAEDLRDYGYEVIWNETDRTLNIYERFENVSVKTDIGEGFAVEEISEYTVKCAQNSQIAKKITTQGESRDINTFTGEYFYSSMFPLKETFDFLNIKYSFENNILTIDTSNAKIDVTVTDYAYEEQKVHSDITDKELKKLYVEKVILDGAETDIQYSYISGHFQNMHTGRRKAAPYICGETVYIPYDFLVDVAKINSK